MISSLGVGSGLDLGGLVDNLVGLERQQAERPLNRRQAKAEVKLSAIGSLSSSVASLASAITSLENAGISRSVTSSFESAVTGSALATADKGSYLVVVDQIAVAQSLATAAASPFADANASLGEGTLTVTVGEQTVEIELAAGQDSLRDVRDAINASSLGIQAAVVQDGSEFMLLLSSGQTGTEGTMTLTVDGSVDTRLASAGMTETAAAQDALFSVNGLGLSSASNTVDEVLPGVTLNLHAQTDGESVLVQVAPDTAGIKEKMAAVVTSYNALINNMKALGGASPDGSQAGPLVGDATLRGLQRDLGSAFYTNYLSPSSENAFTNLVGIGVHTSLAGTATLDASELDAALAVSESGVDDLVSAFTSAFGEVLGNYQGSDGILTIRQDQLGSELRRIRDQRADLERRMETIEARLRARFGALDALVAQFNNTSSFLEQQLATLRTISSGNRTRS